MPTSPRVPWTSAAALEAVRPQVRELLTAIPSYAELTPEERAGLAQNMVKVMSYIANPSGVYDEPPPVAKAQDANEETREALSKSPDTAGKKFVGGAAREGVKQFKKLVDSVDFPKFVGGLVNNVFRAIVETSIEQMRAYGELIASVAKSVDQFMQDNIGIGAGRDFLASRFPDALQVEITPAEDGGKPTSRVVTRGEDSEQKLKEISREFGIEPPLSDLSDDKAELRLVLAARLQLARSRQQLLASMVMLGINRIVVTDGTINAKVRFDMRSTDDSNVGYKAAANDEQTQRNAARFGTQAGGLFGSLFGASASASAEHEDTHVATVSTSVDESSSSNLEMSARLQGEVRVNFKSDYLPLEKMATPEMIAAITGNSSPAAAKPPATPASAAPPAGGTVQPGAGGAAA
jgi:hypothetical protein